MSRFWSTIVNTLTPYVPGEQPKMTNLVKLNTNENPFGPSPHVIAAINNETNDNLKLYPDPHSDALVKTIATHFGLDASQVFVGNGSDEVLAHTFMGLLNHDTPLLFPDITYSFYPVYCQLYGIEAQQIPLTDTFSIDLEKYPTDAKAVIFPNPNAPTGKLESLTAIRQFLHTRPNTLLVVDEAYIDFGGQSAASLVNEFDNLLVIQTFSKSRSLAGMRLGFALGHVDLIEALKRVKDSFNSYPIDRLAAAAGIAAIEDNAYFEQCCQAVITTREWTTAELTKLGYEVIPSAANFIFASPTDVSAAVVFEQLRQQGIIVRWFNKEKLKDHLRISIGTNAQMEALIKALNMIHAA